MANLALTLAFPQVRVVSGENFPARITIANTGRAAVVAPADFGDDDYRFAFAPAGGGDPTVLSRQASESAARPGDPTERLRPPPAPITQELGAGESRVAQVFPARLAVRPIPPGVYDVSVSLLSAPAVVSPPARLTIEASNIVRYHITGSGPLSGAELTYLHRDGSAAYWLFGGTGKADAPTQVAGLRIAQVAGPIEGLQFAHAVHPADISAPLMAAWLSGSGAFFTSVAQSAYVVANAGPLELGLSEAQLAPTGWKTGERYFAASFAVLGKGANGVELALLSLNRDDKWAPKAQRIPLALPGIPKIWRLSQRAEGGHVLFAGYSKDAGSRLLKLQVGGDGTAQAGPIELLSIPYPLVTLSAPLIVSSDAVLQALSGPKMVERAGEPKYDAAMFFHAIPIDGAPPREMQVPVPLVNGALPSDWSLAEGAPAVAALVARSATTLLGVRIGEQVRSTILVQDASGCLGPTAILIGANAWAVWREGTDRIESRPFRR
jgi:hypothetical protein